MVYLEVVGQVGWQTSRGTISHTCPPVLEQTELHTEEHMFRNCGTGIIAAHTEEHMSHSVQELWHRYNSCTHRGTYVAFSSGTVAQA